MLPLLKRLLCVAAIVLAAIWFLSAVVGGFSAPSWVPPTAVLALAVGVLL